MVSRALLTMMLAMFMLTDPSWARTDGALLSPLYSDHAVFQRDAEILIRGRANPHEIVEVEFGGERRRATTDGEGEWRASLSPRPAGGPFKLTAKTRTAEQAVLDIMIGDVYLCSGQSNMELALRNATNADFHIEFASDPNLRLLHIPRAASSTPGSEVFSPDGWRLADSKTAPEFSALCFLFGKEVRAAQKIPIGLIEAAWGGTRIEAWMSKGSLERIGGYAKEFKAVKAARGNVENEVRRYLSALSSWWRNKEPGALAGYSRADFNDADWPEVTPDGLWETLDAPPLADFDGVAWFRKRIKLNESQAQDAVMIELGPVDDVDVTFVNGRLIGMTDVWDQPRNYELPAGVLHAGENVLAVGVLDTGGGGGMWSGEGSARIRFSNDASVAIDGPWRYRISAPLYKLDPPRRLNVDGPNALSMLFNAMIAPLAQYKLRGVLWYQGESNAAFPQEYEKLLPAMIADWRAALRAPKLPFIIAQLAAFGSAPTAPQRVSWGAIRDVQRRVAEADDNVGLAVAIDIGDAYDIHPSQKSVLAKRMALVARKMIYDEDVVDAGPGAVSALSGKAGIILKFQSGGLIVRSSNRPIAFELCDRERSCRFVDAEIEEGASVRLPTARAGDQFVRYCWGNAPVCNLYNEAGLPAAPFELEVRQDAPD